jgi:ankyrin repeat protein
MKKTVYSLFYVFMFILLGSCISFDGNSGKSNSFFGDQNSLLAIARSGTADQARKAISNGADINEKNLYGVTPLIFACANKDTEIAKILIEAGADVNVEAAGGYTPLFYAVEINRDNIIEIINLLIISGANIEHKNYKGQTVLLYAAEMNDNEKIIQILIDLKADIDAKDNQGHDFAYFLELNKGNKGIIY